MAKVNAISFMQFSILHVFPRAPSPSPRSMLHGEIIKYVFLSLELSSRRRANDTVQIIDDDKNV